MGRVTRRTALTTMLSAITVRMPEGRSAASERASRGKERLWYRQPAATWNEALPVGNGHLGAMLFGRMGQERLQLNENTLWAGAPYWPENPEALAALPQVRALINAGRYKEADALASARMMATPLWQMPYGTLGDLLLTFADAGKPAEYERSLDLARAVATVEYRCGAARFRRELFASAPDGVAVLRLQARGARMAFRLDYRGPREVGQLPPNYTGPVTATVPASDVDWLMREDVGALGEGVAVVPDGGNAVLITGRGPR